VGAGTERRPGAFTSASSQDLHLQNISTFDDLYHKDALQLMVTIKFSIVADGAYCTAPSEPLLAHVPAAVLVSFIGHVGLHLAWKTRQERPGVYIR